MTNLCDLVSHRQHTASDSVQRRILQHIHSHRSLVESLGYSCDLQGHKGCVNCLQWNTSGSLLASGSDDLSVHLWNPYQRKAVATMQTGHTGNIFSVKFLPYSGDQMLITGAEDGEVRMHDLSSFDTTQVWSCSEWRVKRVAVSPHSPYVCWSASEDGCVRRMDTREPHSCQGDGTCRNVIIDLKRSCGASLTHTVQCKCIDINPVRTEQIAVGALDAYVRIYDARLCTPKSSASTLGTKTTTLPQTDPSCIACFSPGHIYNFTSRRHSCNPVASTYVSFSSDGQELLVNLSGEQVYLYDLVNFIDPISYEFDRSDLKSVPKVKPITQTYRQHLSRVNGIGMKLMPLLSESHSIPGQSIDESDIDDEVMKLKNDGKEFYKEEKLNEALASLNIAISLCSNWHMLYFLRGTALYSRKWTGDTYAALRDIETSLALSPGHKLSRQRQIQCQMELGLREEATRLIQQYQIDYPADGKFISRTKREMEKSKRDPVRHPRQNGCSLLRPSPPHRSDYKSRYCGHCNTHTDIKEAVFIGDRGNYIAAGSDDGNIFIWDKNNCNLVRVLKGDVSIVNCIQWHPTSSIMATSGIENVVRLWEPKRNMESGSRIVSDFIRVSKENQQRKRVGFILGMAMAEGGEGAMADWRELQSQEEEEEEMDDGSELRWINDPSNCRQS